MNLWKQSNIVRWLQAGMVMAAVVIPSSKNILADDVPARFVVNDDSSTLPALLLENHSEDKALAATKLRKKAAENASLKVSSRSIVINTLPYTITQSGNYSIDRDLDLTDPAATGAAIIVRADNVSLDLGNHNITVSPTISAIFLNNASNFSMRNGKLQTALESDNANSIGVLINRVARAVFDNIVFLNTKRGAFSTNSQDLTFTNCRFDHPVNELTDGGRGIQASNGTQGLHVENCVFGLIGNVSIFIQTNELQADTRSASIRNCKFLGSDAAGDKISSFGVYLASRNGANPITNVEISDCKFHYNGLAVGIEEAAGVEIRHCTFTDHGHGIEIDSGSDIIVQGCSFNREWDTPYSSIFFLPFGVIKNVKIQDCTSTSNGGSTIEILSGFDNIPPPSNVLVKNCVFSTDDAPGTIWAGHVSGLVVKDCILRNGMKDDRYACIELYSEGAVVDNCLLAGYIGCKLSGAANCEIKNCTITNSVVGVFLNKEATNNLVRNNTIFGNSADGIFVDASSSSNTIIDNSVINNGANGIFVTSWPNTVRGNTVSQNGGDGLLNTGGETNLFLENASCNNGGANCTGIPAAIAPAPGSPPVVGGNICCP